MCRWLRFVLCCFFIALFPAATFADWQIGEYQMARSHAITSNTLQTRPSGRAGLSSYAFVGRVGGISLEATAELPEDMKNLPLRMEYSEKEPDGSRLKVYLGEKAYPAKIYDWQMVPIAKFADSEFTGVVSLFGEKSDDSQFNIIYHPAFLDTLLGVRLLQADSILIDIKQFSRLPRFNGKLVLGEGEKDFSVSPTSIEAVQKIIDKYDIQSWVVTDVGRTPRIRTINGSIDVDIQPYFHFWRSDIPEGAEPLLEEYTKLDSFVSALEGNPSVSKKINDLKSRMEAIERKLKAMEPKVIAIPEATQELENSMSMVESLNPPVFEALRTTDRYAALFRLAKRQDPQKWSIFLKSLSAVSLPPIEAPNVWPKSKTR
jgi:hypothetical protein